MSSRRRPYQLTPEQIALAEERRRKKEERARELASRPMASIYEEKGPILERAWVELRASEAQVSSSTFKVVTWNLLAQTLVRRELFPTSDCLKAPQRENMIYNEIISRSADILCLQEVDRLEKLLPVLDAAGYSHTYKAGPKKLHGCLIAYKKNAFAKVDERVIYYDEQEIRSDTSERARRGGSFRTKNIASILALKMNGGEDGIVVATTHLFWHPRYTYERTRQTGILFREVEKFREQTGHNNWPCIVTGDFNFPPSAATYSLLFGEPLSLEQETTLLASRVVHRTMDPTIVIDTPKTNTDDDEEDAEADPDRVITNARPAIAADGLLTITEIVALFSSLKGRVRSSYDEGQRKDHEIDKKGLTYGERVGWPSGKPGAHEPVWTNYTHYFKGVLDYIFIIDAPSRPLDITGYLQSYRSEDLEPGLPRKGVCGSDHVAVCVQLSRRKIQ